MTRTRITFLALTLVAICAAAQAQEPVTAAECEFCHEDVVQGFIAGPHGGAMAKQAESIVQGSCVACHGPVEAHLEDPSTETISTSPGSEKCTQCHESSQVKMELFVPAHNRNRIDCLQCHDPGHGVAVADNLLIAEPRKLCSDCHRSQAAAFNLPFAHRNGVEAFECSACHATHGDNRVGRLNLISAGGACIDCHTDKARPFVYPHPPVDRPGCVACHMPHGSTNPRMLTRYSVDSLCLECHANVPAFHDITQPRYRLCQNCHTAVHGSNRDPRLIEQ